MMDSTTPSATPKTERHRLGKTSEIPVGQARSFRAAGKDLIVVNTGDGFRGYVNFCTHMGGKLRCMGAKFQCNMHGARFDCATGEAEAGGQAPEGSKLEGLEIVIEGEDIWYIHTVKKSPWAME